MSRYYVISPNVENDGNIQDYLEQMFQTHTIMMGWSPQEHKGKMFDEMQIGDYVICARGANKNKQIFFAGMVSSENSHDWPYTRKLTGFVDLGKEKIEFGNNNAFGSSARIPAIYELKKDNEADYEICKYIKLKVDAMISKENLYAIIDVLKTKKNIILQGAPGTGKTYSTIEIALNICGVNTLSLSREDMIKIYNDLSQKGQIAFSTFHQTMDYDDFIEGLKPQLENGQVTYDIEDGIFKKICQDASIKGDSNFDECYDKLLAEIQNTDFYPIKSSGGAIFHVAVNSKQNLTLYTGKEKKMNGVLTKENIRLEYFGHGPKYWVGYNKGVVNKLYADFGLKSPVLCKDKNYVLIIDEINRGNISKIFGELITLIESDKREGKTNCISAKLSYSKMDFSVPDNLYIIGTMNTLHNCFKFAFEVDFRLLTGKHIISVTTFEIKTNTFIIFVIVGQILFYGIIVSFYCRRNAICRNKSALTQYIEYFFCIFHAYSDYVIIGNYLELFGIYQRIFHVITCFILVSEIQSFGILRCYLAEKQDSVVCAQLLMIIVAHYKLKQMTA